MYYSDQIISKLQADKILAKKLEEALSGVKERVVEQVSRIGDGATRLLYYTSCFTEEYQDVCAMQKIEDARFRYGIYHLIKNRNIISELIRIYVNLLLKYRTSQQLEYIKILLMKANIHISASSLTNQAFALGVTSAICLGMNTSMHIRNKIAGLSGMAASVFGGYGIIQESADSARRLQVMYPAYYQALYMHELEMMYFLVEPMFIKARLFMADFSSDDAIADAIARMVR